MPDFNSINKQFSTLMKRSKLEMPYGDFEENVMHRIRKEVLHKKVFSTDIKISFFFFLLGTIFGLHANSILQRSQQTILGISAESTLLIFQVIFVLLFLTQLENFIKTFRRPKKWTL